MIYFILFTEVCPWVVHMRVVQNVFGNVIKNKFLLMQNISGISACPYDYLLIQNNSSAARDCHPIKKCLEDDMGLTLARLGIAKEHFDQSCYLSFTCRTCNFAGGRGRKILSKIYLSFLVFLFLPSILFCLNIKLICSMSHFS